MEEILASSVLKHYGLFGSIAIVDNNNIPFIGDLMRRCSKEKKRDIGKGGMGTG